MIGRPVLAVTRGLDAGVWGQTEFQVNLKLGLTPRRVPMTGQRVHSVKRPAPVEGGEFRCHGGIPVSEHLFANNDELTPNCPTLSEYCYACP